MRTIYFSILLASVFLVTTVMNVFASETIESMATRVAARLETIDAIEFTLRVRSNSLEAHEIKEARHEYAFFRSKDINYPRSWERWKVFYEKQPGVWDLDKFVAFNGKTVWTWDRIISPSPDNPEGFNMWSRGVIRTTVTPDVYMSGEGIFAANEFPLFLFMNVVGYGKSHVDDFIRSLGLEKWQAVDSASPSEHILQRVIQAPGWDESSKYFIRAYLRLNPIPVVCRTENAIDFLDKTERFDFMNIETFKTFDGIYYPAKGSRVSYSNKNIYHDTIYEFEVESVKRLAETDKTRWVPDWPTGTIVVDMISGKNTEIRPTKEQMLERQEEYYAKLGVDRKINTHGRRNWIILIVNVIGGLLLLWLLYKKFSTQGK